MGNYRDYSLNDTEAKTVIDGLALAQIAALELCGREEAAGDFPDQDIEALAKIAVHAIAEYEESLAAYGFDDPEAVTSDAATDAIVNLLVAVLDVAESYDYPVDAAYTQYINARHAELDELEKEE